MQSVNVLYFAALGAKLGCRKETVDVPGNIKEVNGLQNYLSQRSDDWAPLTDVKIRCAVNQCIAAKDASIKDGDEIAFFPPVTGG